MATSTSFDFYVKIGPIHVWCVRIRRRHSLHSNFISFIAICFISAQLSLKRRDNSAIAKEIRTKTSLPPMHQIEDRSRREQIARACVSCLMRLLLFVGEAYRAKQIQLLSMLLPLPSSAPRHSLRRRNAYEIAIDSHAMPKASERAMREQEEYISHGEICCCC